MLAEEQKDVQMPDCREGKKTDTIRFALVILNSRLFNVFAI